MLRTLCIAACSFREVQNSPASIELPRGHVPALDAIRGLAIVLVTLYRFGGGTEGPGRAVYIHGLSYLGMRGVDLFFVLSGFLITGILFDAKGQANALVNFYMRRILRILPLYYGALFLTLLVVPRLSPSLAHEFQPATDYQAWLWLYSANLLQAKSASWCLGPLNHFWSLAVEEHFYLAWPAVICFASRTAAMRICLSVAGISALSRAVWLASGGNDIAAEVFTPLRMDGLALGSWVALVARGPRGFGWLNFWAAPTLVAAGVFIVGACLFSPRCVGLPYLAWGVAFAAILVRVIAAPADSRIGRCGASPLLQFFGKYSYGMYVFQLPLVALAAPLMTAPGLAIRLGSSWLGQLVYCAVMLGITTILAFTIWHCFEKHFLALKHYFPDKAQVGGLDAGASFSPAE